MRISALHLLRHVGHQSVQKPGCSVMVSRLSWITGTDQVKDYFSKYGDVTFVHLPINFNQGVHKGYGFVHFADRHSANEAVEDQQRPKLDHVFIHVKHAGDNKPAIPHKK